MGESENYHEWLDDVPLEVGALAGLKYVRKIRAQRSLEGALKGSLDTRPYLLSGGATKENTLIESSFFLSDTLWVWCRDYSKAARAKGIPFVCFRSTATPHYQQFDVLMISFVCAQYACPAWKLRCKMESLMHLFHTDSNSTLANPFAPTPAASSTSMTSANSTPSFFNPS